MRTFVTFSDLTIVFKLVIAGYPPLPNDYDGFSCGAHRQAQTKLPIVSSKLDISVQRLRLLDVSSFSWVTEGF